MDDAEALPTPPTVRELELERLLRSRETDIGALKDEVSTLQKHLAVANRAPADTDSVTVAPALLSLLLPYLTEPRTLPGSTTGSSVTSALTQRVKLLQEENDEMYQILRRSETGRLDEEVRGMRKVIAKLESALRESHTIINSLSTELDKTYENIEELSKKATSQPSAPRAANQAKPESTSPSPAFPRHSLPSPHLSNASVASSAAPHNGSGNKPIPTGPRAHKKPRINPSPTPSSAPSNHPSSTAARHGSNPPSNHPLPRGLPAKPSHSALENGSRTSSMDVDEDARARPRGELQIRGSARRAAGGGSNTSGSGSGRGSSAAPGRRTSGRGGFGGGSGDRTLVERMGL